MLNHRTGHALASLSVCSPSVLPLAVALASVLISTQAYSDVWVFEPSAAIDQRVDDNYTINPTESDPVSATRLVGTVGLSREAQAASFKGLLRVDGLITQSDKDSDELSSNQVFFLDSQFRRARSNFGIGLNFKQDTPSRDISADIIDISSVAADTGASVTQDQNVGRQRWVLTPRWEYNLTRRTTIDAELTYTNVAHELPSAEEALTTRLESLQSNGQLDPDATINDVQVFEVEDELDDFQEFAVNLGVKSKLSPITTLTFSAGYSDYVANTEPDANVIIPFDDLEEGDDPRIRRRPKRETRSNTSTFRIGYDRSLTPTLNVGFQVGIYSNTTDKSDLLRDNDNTRYSEEGLRDAKANRIAKQSGYLANITATKNTGITKYTAKFGVDVLPSDVGSQVESLEAIGDLFREVGPLLDFSFRVRAYEPDAFNADSKNKFARRFLSIEPKLIWRFTRAWTVAGSYRYRRQKSQVDTNSGESNAILFSLKYTPPSAIRDAEAAK